MPGKTCSYCSFQFRLVSALSFVCAMRFATQAPPQGLSLGQHAASAEGYSFIWDPKTVCSVCALETALKLQVKIAKLRLAGDFTQKMLPREAGIGLRTLRLLEVGQPTSPDTFLRVARLPDLNDG